MGEQIPVLASTLHDLHRVSDRRQRIPQFMRQCRKKLILPAVGVLKLLFYAFALGDVTNNTCEVTRIALSCLANFRQSSCLMWTG